MRLEQNENRDEIEVEEDDDEGNDEDDDDEEETTEMVTDDIDELCLSYF